jgi:hypothetical protein
MPMVLGLMSVTREEMMMLMRLYLRYVSTAMKRVLGNLRFTSDTLASANFFEITPIAIRHDLAMSNMLSFLWSPFEHLHQHLFGILNGIPFSL